MIYQYPLSALSAIGIMSLVITLAALSVSCTVSHLLPVFISNLPKTESFYYSLHADYMILHPPFRIMVFKCLLYNQ